METLKNKLLSVEELQKRITQNSYTPEDLITAVEVVDSNIRWLMAMDGLGNNNSGAVSFRLETRAALINQLPESPIKQYLKDNAPKWSDF